MTKKANVETTAEAYLELLAARGIDYFFGNAGTDFAPIIEAYTRRRARGQLLPRPAVVDRALAIPRAEPPAPVYLTLPTEVLPERHDSFEYADPPRAPRPGDVVAAPEAIDEAARILAAEKNPVVITKALGRDPRAV